MTESGKLKTATAFVVSSNDLGSREIKRRRAGSLPARRLPSVRE